MVNSDSRTDSGPGFRTLSGIPVDGVYGDGPLPGEFPYTRGVHAEMYRSRLWTMRMFAGFPESGEHPHGPEAVPGHPGMDATGVWELAWELPPSPDPLHRSPPQGSASSSRLRPGATVYHSTKIT